MLLLLLHYFSTLITATVFCPDTPLVLTCIVSPALFYPPFPLTLSVNRIVYFQYKLTFTTKTTWWDHPKAFSTFFIYPFATAASLTAAVYVEVSPCFTFHVQSIVTSDQKLIYFFLWIRPVALFSSFFLPLYPLSLSLLMAMWIWVWMHV